MRSMVEAAAAGRRRSSYEAVAARGAPQRPDWERHSSVAEAVRAQPIVRCVADFRRVELLAKVRVGVRKQVLREHVPGLIAPVHGPELVHVEIARARAALERRFAELDHLPPVAESLVRAVANPALRFVVNNQFLARQPRLPILVMNQQNARREAVSLGEVHDLESFFRRRAPDDAAHDHLKRRLLRKELQLLPQWLQGFCGDLCRIDPVHADLHVGEVGAVEGVDKRRRQTPSVRNHHAPPEAQPLHLGDEVGQTRVHRGLAARQADRPRAELRQLREA